MDVTQAIRLAVAQADILLSDIGEKIPYAIISLVVGIWVGMAVILRCRR